MASSADCLVANSRSTETEVVEDWIGERVEVRIGSGENALCGWEIGRSLSGLRSDTKAIRCSRLWNDFL